jgi:competence protein ComEA
MTDEKGSTGHGFAALRARANDAVRFHPREAVALAVLGMLVVIGALLAYSRGRPASAASLAPAGAPSVEASVSPPARIVVHVVGAVRKPGVYPFDPGARVIDAVRAAGGFARGADRQTINLARALVDGEQVFIPRHGEKTRGVPSARHGSGPPANQSGKVNINDASASDFERLPGIGPVLARRIVEYRTQHGPFRVARDLMKVPGIGEKKFKSLEPYVTV